MFSQGVRIDPRWQTPLSRVRGDGFWSDGAVGVGHETHPWFERFIIPAPECFPSPASSFRKSWRLPACDVLETTTRRDEVDKRTYISYVHRSTFNAKIFTPFVVRQGVLQTTTCQKSDTVI